MGRRARETRFHAQLAAALAGATLPRKDGDTEARAGARPRAAAGDKENLAPGRQSPPASPSKGARADAEPAADADAALFARAVAGARALRGEPARLAPPRVARAAPSEDQLALAELEDLVAGDGPFRITDSEEAHAGLAPGVSYALLARLRRGEFAFLHHLDLHGMSRDTAHRELARFVAGARRGGERCVLVITGRGKSSPAGLAVLREALPRWLTRAPLRAHVLAFCTARPSDGGPGAFYVLLRRAGVRPFGTLSP